MSRQTALQFIIQLRNSTALSARVQALGMMASVEEVRQLGAETGLDFTAAELHEAFRQDWAMRWLRYEHQAHLALKSNTYVK